MKWAVFIALLGGEQQKTQGGEIAARADDCCGPDRSLG